MNLLFFFVLVFDFFPKYNIIFHFCFQQEYKIFSFFGIISPVRYFKKPFNRFLETFYEQFFIYISYKERGGQGTSKTNRFPPHAHTTLYTYIHTLSLPSLLYSCLIMLFITDFLNPNFSNFWSVPLRHILDQFIGAFRRSCFCKRIFVEGTIPTILITKGQQRVVSCD